MVVGLLLYKKQIVCVIAEVKGAKFVGMLL